jgi:predicted dithiol-disulfide oxidoreductase (DUF899 family)
MFDPATASKSTGWTEAAACPYCSSTGWTEAAACPYCSFWMDNFNGIVIHLNQRDVTMVAVSRAPYAKLAAYQHRMGWTFPWF